MTRMRIAAIGLVAASLTVAGFAGCGGSDSSNASSETAAGATTSAPLTKDELITAATAVCTDIRAQFAAGQENLDQTDLAGLKSFTADAQAASEKAIADLKALAPPDEIAAEYTAYVDAQAAVVDAGAPLVDTVQSATTPDEVVAALSADDPERTALEATADEAAIAAGLPECAKD